jgi:hypothetical protein
MPCHFAPASFRSQTLAISLLDTSRQSFPRSLQEDNPSPLTRLEFLIRSVLQKSTHLSDYIQWEVALCATRRAETPH